MGAQWKHAGRVENANKRGALISKLVKEIIVAAKSDPNPEGNSRLRVAIENAKKASVPRENIERAIKKGSGQDGAQNYDKVTYEGFGPMQVPVIVECLTDNKNRTAADLRVLFRKGQLGSPGSVAWMFDLWGVVEVAPLKSDQDAETLAIEIGAQNVTVSDQSVLFFCEKEDLDSVTKAAENLGLSLMGSEISYMIKNPVEVPADHFEEVVSFFNSLDENDDVHRLYTGLKT